MSDIILVNAAIARKNKDNTFSGINTFEQPIVGSATLNVLKAGDTMTGTLQISVNGDTGSLFTTAGALFVNNTNNLGNAVNVYSNAGATATAHLSQIKVDNSAFVNNAFYIEYDGASHAQTINNLGTGTSNNALNLASTNSSDSTLGVSGVETGRGTVKITHTKPSGSDANSSGLSIDLQGSGTSAQGIFVDSTVAGGTLGNLLVLRNDSVARFYVDKLGSLFIGSNGTNTSITKTGNTAGDEFFVGTTGAFRVQRSGSNSEAFRVQISGDTQGRWLGTSDGRLKWGSGSATQDTFLIRSAANTLHISSDGSTGAGNLIVTGAVTINESGGATSDFRVEGDTDANLVFVDASADKVGIGLNNPAYKLDVNGDINIPAANTYRVGTTAGVSGSFTTADAKTVTVVKGIITAIV